jgi:hypothetical protein
MKMQDLKLGSIFSKNDLKQKETQLNSIALYTIKYFMPKVKYYSN